MMNSQKKIGQWVMGLGCLLLIAVFGVCMFDLGGIAARGQLLVPLWGYLTAIFTGVAMQFVGAAIPNMRFRPEAKPAK